MTRAAVLAAFGTLAVLAVIVIIAVTSPQPSTSTPGPTVTVTTTVTATASPSPADPAVADLGMTPDPAARCKFASTAPNWLPDDTCSPGVVATTDRTLICEAGYAESVRNVPQRVKDAVLAEYGLHEPQFTGNIDHRLALSLGGSNDPANLAPISVTGNARKNTIEQRVRDAVCEGRMSVADAQARFLAGHAWPTAATSSAVGT